MNLAKFKRSVKYHLSKYGMLDYLLKNIWVNFQQLRFFLKYGFLNVDENKIIFECFKGKFINDSPFAIYKKLIELNLDYKFVWVVKDFNSDAVAELREDKNTSFVKYGTKEYLKEYATSSFWVVNCRVPFRLVKKKKQTYIQCWHGTPLKKMAHDINIGNNVNTSLSGLKFAYSHESKRINYFLSPSRYASECFCSSFNMIPEKILEQGYPRNDDLVTLENKTNIHSKIKEKIGIPDGKKVILYAPTWRDNKTCQISGQHILTNPLDSIDFVHSFTDSIFLYRGHYFTKPEFAMDNFIDVSEYDSINELFLISDVLITDYSSLFFDYAILNKPVLFYMPDLDEYKNKTRGFYLDVHKDLPGSISSNIEELKRALSECEVDDNKFVDFNMKYNTYEDGNSSLRVIQKVGILK